MKKNYVTPRTTKFEIKIETGILQVSKWPGGPEMPDKPTMPSDNRKSYIDLN